MESLPLLLFFFPTLLWNGSFQEGTAERIVNYLETSIVIRKALVFS